MDLPALLDVLIGMSLTFGIVAAAAAGLAEAIARLLATRANGLEAALKEALTDQDLAALSDRAKVHGLDRAARFLGLAADAFHAYVPRAMAAAAIAKNAETWLAQPGNCPVPAIAAIAAEAQNDQAKLRAAAEAWFDARMEALGSAFAARQHAIALAFGFLIAVWFDVSALRLFDFLWTSQAARDAAAAYAAAGAQAGSMPIETAYQTLADTLALPLREGPWVGCLPDRIVGPAVPTPANCLVWWLPAAGWLTVLGWTITGLAAAFGAKYWFDMARTILRFKPAKATADGAT